MTSAFHDKLVSVALDQFSKYHLLRETQQPLRSQIEKYWTDLGMSFPGVATPWSAVFVSWCVKQAGATSDDFHFSASHAGFVSRAIANQKNNTGVTRGFPAKGFEPEPGDIIQNNRSGHTFDFDYASKHSSYESHSAIVVEIGQQGLTRYAKTIGGNESDSVGMKHVPLDNAWRIDNSSGIYIAAMRINL